MTGRSLMLTAVVASVVATLAVLARPFLPHPHDVATSQMRTPAVHAAPPPQLMATAVDAAIAAMRCPPAAVSRPACGWLTVTGAAGYPSGPGRFTVRIVGALSEAGDSPLPVAVQVRLVEVDGRWSTAVVAP